MDLFKRCRWIWRALVSMVTLVGSFLSCPTFKRKDSIVQSWWDLWRLPHCKSIISLTTSPACQLPYASTKIIGQPSLRYFYEEKFQRWKQKEISFVNKCIYEIVTGYIKIYSQGSLRYSFYEQVSTLLSLVERFTRSLLWQLIYLIAICTRDGFSNEKEEVGEKKCGRKIKAMGAPGDRSSLEVAGA